MDCRGWWDAGRRPGGRWDVAGRWLVALAVVMLLAPDALQTLAGMVVVFAGAGCLALLLWLIVGRLSGRIESPAPDG